MDRALPRPLELSPAFWPRARTAGLIVLALVNIVMVIQTILFETMGATDWRIMQRAADLAGTPALYTQREAITFVWSPVAAYPLQLLDGVSVWAWRGVLIVAALALPTWRMRLIVLVSWPFWTDLTNGNMLTIVFLTAVYAWRGSRFGTFTFFALALLIPRPLLAPMGLWILWKRPEWRWPFAGMFAVHAALVLWTGLGPEWIGTLVAVGPDLIDSVYNHSPSRELGYWWLLVGVPVGGWLFWRGRVGWAGLAISPYIWVYYLFWLLPDVNRPLDRDGERPLRFRGPHAEPTAR